jgi:hypothetical protein
MLQRYKLILIVPNFGETFLFYLDGLLHGLCADFALKLGRISNALTSNSLLLMVSVQEVCVSCG